MDFLAAGKYLFDKNDQPALRETGDWRNTLKPD
jgi:hypothetical protein